LSVGNVVREIACRLGNHCLLGKSFTCRGKAKRVFECEAPFVPASFVLFQAELLPSHLEPWNEVTGVVLRVVSFFGRSTTSLLEVNLRIEESKMMDDEFDYGDDDDDDDDDDGDDDMDMTGAEWHFNHHYGHVIWSLLEKYIYLFAQTKDEKGGKVCFQSFFVGYKYTRWWAETTNYKMQVFFQCVAGPWFQVAMNTLLETNFRNFAPEKSVGK